MYNTKNYAAQGGDVWHIGGTLEVEEGATVTGIGGGTFTPAANQAASTATDAAALVTDFNALLTKLKAAGLMEADA